MYFLSSHYLICTSCCLLVCGLTSHELDIKVDVEYFVCHASNCRALVQALTLRYYKQLLVCDELVHECCDTVAVFLHVCKIEHAPHYH